MPPLPALDGLTRGEARMLHMLHVADGGEEPVRPGPLSAQMRTTPSAVSQMIKDLEGKGLVVRERGGGDFRSVTLALTEEGRRLAEGVDEAYTAFARGLFEEIGYDDMRSFLATLGRIVGYCDRVCGTEGAAAGKGGTR